MAKTLLNIYVCIGNTDDKLSQARWSRFAQETDRAMKVFAKVVYGVFFSLSHSRYQNACWAVGVYEDKLPRLREELAVLAGRYEQDSIALSVAETQFVAPREEGGDQ